MKQKAKQFIKHPLVHGSTVVILGGLFANFFNFLFNLFMSRNLTIEEYGVLASIISLVVFPSLVSTALVPVIVRFAGDYFAKNDYPLLRGLYIKINRLLFLIGGVIFLLFILSLNFISNFFHIADKNILIMTNFVVFISIINVLNIAYLQAKLAFGFQIFVSVTNAVSRLILGIVFVFMGYAVGGATLSMILSGSIAYVISFIPLKFVFDRKILSPYIATSELLSYGLPSALALLGLTSFITADIMLVKHFFEPRQAGLYAGLSLISRVIFYVAAPIGNVMFPVIVQRHSKNENFSNTFKLSLLLAIIPSILLAVFYFLFPKFSIIFFLKREEYLAIAPFLAPFAIYITLYVILSITCNFYLSIKKTKVFIPILVGAILQIVLIYFIHGSISQIITISMAITFVLICILLLYYPRAIRK